MRVVEKGLTSAEHWDTAAANFWIGRCVLRAGGCIVARWVGRLG